MRLKLLGASAGAIALMAAATPFVAAKHAYVSSSTDVRAQVTRCFDMYDDAVADISVDSHGASATVLARVRLRQCILRALMNKDYGNGHSSSRSSSSSMTSSSSSNTSSSSSSVSSSSSTGSSVSSSSTSSTVSTVSISGFAYAPATITVKKGTTVVWTNTDTSNHTVTRDGSHWWSVGPLSGSLGTGMSYSYTFNATGTYSYHCSFHPDMKGTVVVTD